MQTPKFKRSNYNSNGAQPASRSNSHLVLSSPRKTTQTHKDGNNKNIQRQATLGRVNERSSSKMSDLEACFAQLEDDLKKTKDQASSSEFQKRQVLFEVEQGRRKITAISAKLKETSEQLIEISSSEDDRLQELCKLSQERDRAWALELEAVRKHHSLDVAALSSAKDEIQKLKKQLEMVTVSEAVQSKRSQFAEEQIRKMQFEIIETQELAEKFKTETSHCKAKTQRMPKTVKFSNHATHKAGEPFYPPSLEMEQSEDSTEHREDVAQLKNKIRLLTSQVRKLRTALDTAEKNLLEKSNMLQTAETEKTSAFERAKALDEAKKVLESKVLYLTQEADQTNRRVSIVMEKLEAAHAANREIEMELSRQKVQCDQWRKAAETATAVLNADRGKYLDRNESMDSSYLTNDSRIGSASSESANNDDETSKKKNGKMLQKMGVLWKKNNSMRPT